MSNSHDLDLDITLNSARQEPVVTSEDAREHEEAALIGGARLRADGYFVNVLNPRPRVESTAAAPTVLIVEDDAGTSMVIDAVLKKHGFTTRIAVNLQGILRGVNAKPRPDAVLLDIMLPDANGFAVLERIRRHPDMRDVPVVMLSSLSEPADVAKGLALGAVGYLSKPAKPGALVSALRTVLGM